MMRSRSRRVAFLASLLVVGACSQRSPDAAGDTTTSMRSETAAQGSSAAAPPAAPVPATADVPQGKPVNDPAVINFEGFGPAKFGANEESVRMAWGHPLVSGPAVEGSSCRILAMDPPPDNGRGIRFMVEDGRFVRYDVDVPLHVAPGDIVVGDSADDVRTVHAGRVEEQPHKYVAGGKVLIVSPPNGGDTRLVFEIGIDGRVMNWRMGLQPQVLYVEGCG